MTGTLTLNAGPSSLKFGLYEDADDPELPGHGQIDGIGRAVQLVLNAGGTKTRDQVDAPTQQNALTHVMQALAPHMRGRHIMALVTAWSMAG